MRLWSLLALGILAGCSAPAASPPTLHVTRQEYGSEWPLKVDEGDVGCDLSQRLYFLTPNGTRYGLNGLEMSHGTPGIQAVQILGKDSSPLADRAKTLCK